VENYQDKLTSKKWNINAEMGFIEVGINFFIGLKILSITTHDIQIDFILLHLETEEGKFIIDSKDWQEIQSILRTIKIEELLNKKS
jgi:hypothetical protein